MPTNEMLETVNTSSLDNILNLTGTPILLPLREAWKLKFPDKEFIGTHKIPISIINLTIGKFYCNCGHHGKAEKYYRADLFKCDKCGNTNFLQTRGKLSANLSTHEIAIFANLSSNYRETAEIIDYTNCEDILIEDYKYKCTFKDTYVETTITSDILHLNLREGTLKNSKGKDVSSTKLDRRVFNSCLSKYASTLKYPLKNTTDFWVAELGGTLCKAVCSNCCNILDEFRLLDGLSSINTARENIALNFN
ncbi:hypothetical protein [Clostridium sp.]|uniref:hypothetical protein n=1 Tax=Clostridium sp. TaxID=1506 RepID=UPI003217C94E